MKIVVNHCFGGYGLSDKAYERLIELGIPVKKYVEGTRNEEKVIFDRDLDADKKEKFRSLLGRYWDTWTDSKEGRTDPLVIQVVEELKELASDRFARLEIVEVPDDIEWEIDEYDGSESVEEKHRSW